MSFWLVSLLAGIVAGFALMVMPVAIYTALLLFIGALVRPPRLAKASGLLIGAGATMLNVSLSAPQRCLSAPSCMPPPSTPPISGAMLLVALGGALAIGASIRRDEPPSRASSKVQVGAVSMVP